MKKFLSLILALAMVACMSVTAFAADPTTTLTVEVPDNTPSYTFHCPAAVTLEYGKTDKQTVGDVYVTDVDGYNSVNILVKYTNLINKEDATDVIPLGIYQGSLLYNGETGKDTTMNGGISLYDKEFAGQYQYDANGYGGTKLDAQVSDWTGATPGAIYEATITYVVYTW